VLLPFLGDAEEARRACRALACIERQAGDEIVIADNCPDLVMCDVAAEWPQFRAIPANEEQSAYYARNVAAAVAAGDWFLFLDADCQPVPDIIDRYFAEPPQERDGALAGEVLGDGTQTHLLARYQRDRGYLQQERYVHSPRPYAVTANLLVRAQAWREVGGFLEGVLCDADTDFAWRLQEAGWRLGYRPAAIVTHRHRESLRSFTRQIVGYAAGRAWLNRRYAGAYPRGEPVLMSLPLAIGSAIRWGLAGHVERARFRAIDALVIALDAVGLRRSNSSPSAAKPDWGARAVLVLETFPERDGTGVAEALRLLGNQGSGVRVEASRRPVRQDLSALRAHPASFWEDDPAWRRALDLARLVLRHPVRIARAAMARSRRRPGSPASLWVLAPPAARLIRTSAHQVFAGPGEQAQSAAERLARLADVPFATPTGDA
jgi:GT2 family glycosyltransferase